MGRRNHADPRIRSKLGDDSIDQSRVYQRFVALNINDEAELFRMRNYLSDSIGSALMFSGGQCDFRSPIECGFRDPHVVGGDDNFIETSRATTGLPDMS